MGATFENSTAVDLFKRRCLSCLSPPLFSLVLLQDGLSLLSSDRVSVTKACPGTTVGTVSIGGTIMAR